MFKVNAKCLLTVFCLLLTSILAEGTEKGPYLILPGDNTKMTVLWQLNETANCFLEWGPDTTYSMGSTTTSEYGSDHQHLYTITDLIPGAQYYYRLSAQGETYTGSFHAGLPASATNLKFMAYGDTRTYPADHDIVASSILSTFTLDPCFQTVLVVVGDLVSEGREEVDWKEEFFNPAFPNIQEMLANIPFHSCIGNHELSGSGPDLFLKYFPYPYIADHYWSYDMGPAHFVVVDQYVDYSAGSPQLTWIENDLASTTKTWKFLVLHEPGWSAGGHSNEEDVQEYIQPLCEQYGVSIVFGGHNHYYARAIVNSVQHITTGGGGAPLYSPNPNSPNIVATSENYHFCKISIQGNSLFFTSQKPDGEILDEYTIILGDLFVDANNTSGPWLGTEEHPFKRIQDGIDVAGPSGRVIVAPGTYTENVDFKGKAVAVKSRGGACQTVIDGNQTGSVVTFKFSEGPKAILSGFTITNGNANMGGGIDCSASSYPTLMNNIITGNSATMKGGGINGGGEIINNTIYGNSAFYGGGIATDSTDTRIINSIVWNNTALMWPQIFGYPKITYSDIQDGFAGTGNIDGDPLFVDLASSDFHLFWQSPCINRGTNDGAPAKDFEGDSRPNMGTVDMGADEFTAIHPLEGDVFGLPSSTGGVINLTLNSSLDNAGRNYLVLGSISGTAPGTPLPGGLETLRLNWDVFSEIVLALINTPIYFDFLGTLDSLGASTAQINSGPIRPEYVGTTMYYAYALSDPFDFVSNPVVIEIVP